MMGLELPGDMMRKLNQAMKDASEEEFLKTHDFEPMGTAPDEIINIFLEAQKIRKEAASLSQKSEHLNKKAWIMVEEAVNVYDANIKCDWEGDKIIYVAREKPKVDDGSVE